MGAEVWEVWSSVLPLKERAAVLDWGERQEESGHLFWVQQFFWASWQTGLSGKSVVGEAFRGSSDLCHHHWLKKILICILHIESSQSENWLCLHSIRHHNPSHNFPWQNNPTWGCPKCTYLGHTCLQGISKNYDLSWIADDYSGIENQFWVNWSVTVFHPNGFSVTSMISGTNITTE